MKIILGFLTGALALISGLTIAPETEPKLGVALPTGTALFETSLQDRISSTDTTMSIVSATVRGGGTLSGYQCFTIDEGRTDAEFVCGSLSGTTVSSLERGLDPLTGTSTVAALKFAHRKGANVKITDFPLLQRLRNQANGVETFPNVLKYASGVTPASGGDLTDYEFVTGLAFSGAGVIDATTVAKGVVELATQTEAASSTGTGSSGPLALPASIATSSYNSATAALRVLMTGNDGFLSQAFFPNTITKSLAFSGITTLATTTVNGVALASTTVTTFDASGTWTKPTSGTMALLEAWGAGGSGGSCEDGGASYQATGGGGGEYTSRIMRLSDLGATETITVGAGGSAVSGAGCGAGGTGNAGGNTTIGSHLTANGGAGGIRAVSDNQSGGNGGDSASFGAPYAGSGGASNKNGLYSGGGGNTTTASAAGGKSIYGGGGGGSAYDGNNSGAGGTSKYGGNGGAGSNTSGVSATAGTGLSDILCARPVSSLADEPLAEDDGELGPGLEPFARRSFPFFGRVVENQI